MAMQPYGPPGHNLCSSRRAEWLTPQRRCVGGSDRWPRAVSYSRCKATPRTDGPFSINPAASTRIGRGEGFPTVVEPVAHPPELGGGVAGPVIVRRDEIETAAGHIGNLGGTPRAIVESLLHGFPSRRKTGFDRNNSARNERGERRSHWSSDLTT
jgi:hypothetical protein